MARTDQRAIPFVLIAVAAALLIGRFFYTPGEEKSKGLIRWMSPDAGLALAQQTGKPILFDFTAEWCGPCHMLERDVFSDPALAAEISERFIPIRVTDRLREEGKNSPQVADLQQRFTVRGFPTIVFTNAAGSEEARIEGYRGREHFEKVMERVR